MAQRSRSRPPSWPTSSTRTASWSTSGARERGSRRCWRRACEMRQEVLAPLNSMTLDDLAEFKTANTAPEFLTRHVFERLAEAVRAGRLGRDGRDIAAIRVTIGESPSARAWFEAPLW